MEEGDRTISTKDEAIDESDQEKMLRETTSLLRESENCMYTIQVAPGITMHINIAPESDMEPDGNSLSRVTPSWCISTLIVHNGQHYVNTIHNFIVSPELIRDLGLVREPSVNMLQQLLLNPLELPRNSLTALAPRNPSDGCLNSPMAIYRMVEHYCRYVMRTARILDNVCGWVMPDHDSDLPALLQDIRATSQTLHSMLERVHSSIQVAEHQFGHFEFTLKEEEALPEPEQTRNDEDANTDSADELEPDAELRNCGASDFVGFDDFDDSQIKCDGDSSTSESDMRSSLFLGPTFEEIPQQFWSLSSSDDENDDDQGDEESWESDFGDDDSFDAYMVRQLRAHASGLTTRLNTDWGSLPNEPIQPDDDEWDIGSCGTNYEVEDLHSELSYSSEDLNAWQYNEDRTFETDLSRPLRRLVGDLPPLTAQEERYTWLPPYDEFDYRSSQRTSRDYHELPDESLPLPIYTPWDMPDNMPTSSGSSQSDNQSRNLDTDPYSFSFYSNAIDNLSSSLHADLSQHEIDLDELIRIRETTPEPNSDSDTDGINMELDNDSFYPTHDQLTVPLQSFIQQTDELIAQIWASF